MKFILGVILLILPAAMIIGDSSVDVLQGFLEISASENPKVRELDVIVRQTELENKLERLQNFPRISPGISAGYGSSIPFSLHTFPVTADLTVSIPFAPGSSRLDSRIGELMTERQRKSLEEVRKDLLKDLIDRLIDIYALKEEMVLQSENVLRSGEFVDGVTKQSLYGVVTQTDVLSARLRLLQAEIAEAETRKQLNNKSSRFAALYGEPVPDEFDFTFLSAAVEKTMGESRDILPAYTLRLDKEIAKLSHEKTARESLYSFGLDTGIQFEVEPEFDTAAAEISAPLDFAYSVLVCFRLQLNSAWEETYRRQIADRSAEIWEARIDSVREQNHEDIELLLEEIDTTKMLIGQYDDALAICEEIKENLDKETKLGVKTVEDIFDIQETIFSNMILAHTYRFHLYRLQLRLLDVSGVLSIDYLR